MRAIRDFLDEQFIRFGREIGMEQHRYARGAGDQPHYVFDDAHRQRDRQNARRRHQAIQYQPVQKRRCEGQRIAQPHAPLHDGQNDQQHQLQKVFRHAEGEKRKRGAQLSIHQIRGRNHHRNAHIRLFHQHHTHRQHDKPQKVRKLR